MAKNVEIKARLADPAGTRRRVEAIADEGPWRLEQEDVYFHCRNGRLKIRKAPPAGPELIQYQRAQESGPKESSYWRIACGPELEDALSRALGVRAVVKKARDLFLVGRTRVHLDEVEGLGSFLELEVVLEEGEDSEVGTEEARELLHRLALAETALLEGSYGELVAQLGAAEE
jgi:predicted adenylyl cyclase CyaB